ncbi:hypothetical protein OIU78_016551, partial [Salix suchowensis]
MNMMIHGPLTLNYSRSLLMSAGRLGAAAV